MKLEQNRIYRKKADEQQVMIDWQTNKISEAAVALSRDGMTKSIYSRLKKPAHQSAKHTKSRIWNFNIDKALDSNHFLAKSLNYNSVKIALPDMRLKNNTFSDHGHQNSTDSLASKHRPTLRPLSRKNTSSTPNLPQL